MFEPADGVGRILDQRFGEFRDVGEVAAAHDVEVVVIGRVLLALRSRLDAALRHHGVGVAVAQLGGDDDLGALLLGEDRGRGAGAAAADDQDVGFVGRVGKVDLLGRDPAGGLEHVGDLVRDRIALGRTDLEFAPPLFLEVGVELEAFLAFVEAQERHFLAAFLALDALGAGAFDLLDELFEFRCVGHLPPLRPDRTVEAGFQLSSDMAGSISRSV